MFESLQERYRYKDGRRIMCYVDMVLGERGFFYKVYTGRPCDPNKIQWRFKNFADADKFAKGLLSRGTHILYEKVWR